MTLAPEEFLSFIDENDRKVLARFIGRKDFFERAKALLGPRFEMAMRRAEALKALVEASSSLEAFLQKTSAVSMDIFEAKVRREYEVVLGLGCPEPLAKAKALINLLVERLPDMVDKFSRLEMGVWAKMVEECSTLAALKKQVNENVYKIEEI